MRPGAGRVVPGWLGLLMRRPEQAQIPMMQAYGVGLLPYYPLASGLLTGKSRRNAPLPADARLVVHVGRYKDRFIDNFNWPIVEALEDFATQRGHSLLQLAFGWLAAQPVVSSIIAGATKPEQVAANVKRSIRRGTERGGFARHKPRPRERERHAPGHLTRGSRDAQRRG